MEPDSTRRGEPDMKTRELAKQINQAIREGKQTEIDELLLNNPNAIDAIPFVNRTLLWNSLIKPTILERRNKKQ